MKKTIFIVLCFSLLVLNVEAGVCNDYDIKEYDGTCNSITVNIMLPNYLNKKIDGAYFLRPGYVSAVSDKEGSAFCLDPGSSRPDENITLTEIRELGNENASSIVKNYDDGIYNMYQLFYNNLIEQQNSGGLTDDYVLRQRSYFEFASRVWTYKNGFDALDKSKYVNDPKAFKTCAHYIDDGLNSGSEVSESYCFAEGNKNKEQINNYYNNANKTLWENPLNIEKESLLTIGEDGKKYYNYKFKINFKNDKYHFFDTKYINGINYYDINIGGAYFSLDGFNINGDIDCTDNEKCYDYSGSGALTSGDSVEFKVVLSEEQYNKYYSEYGDVGVTMNYSYRHPLNIENLFTASYDLINTYQRMLIVKDYIHIGTETIGKTIDNEEKKECKHDEKGFIIPNGDNVNLSIYLNNCSCLDVNTDILSDSELELYNSKCASTLLSESYYGKISDCNKTESYYSTDSYNNFSNYNLGYKSEIKINDYCNVKCDENVNIKNLKGRYITDAGRYFSFAVYPELNGNKQCDIIFDKNKFKTDYKSNLEVLVSKYNAWQEAKMASSSLTTSTCNPYKCSPCGSKGCNTCYETLYIYDYTYNQVVIENETSLNTKSVSSKKESCGSPIDWKESEKLNEFQKLSANVTSINNLKTSLKACNDYLINQTNDQFYQFQSNLKYYYYQTYSDNKIGSINNTERNKYGGIDDSDFNYNLTDIDNNLNADGIDQKYSSLSEEGIIDETIKTYELGINRSSKITVQYTGPKENKYVGVYTSDMLSSMKNNYINIGYKYDTDISAVAKKGNVTYYEFSALGSTDNKIFNHFKDDKVIRRYCDYEIRNNIINNNKPQFYYRIVDPSNIDPNGRLTDNLDNGFKNWDNVKGKTVIENIKNNNTFNPDNLEYSFTLDSSIIKSIREYNKDISYSTITDTSSLNCNSAGNECLSTFIEESYKDKPNLNGKFTTKFATNISGSNKWKYLECINKGCNIATYKRNSAEYNSLEKYAAKQQVLRNISGDNTINP